MKWIHNLIDKWQKKALAPYDHVKEDIQRAEISKERYLKTNNLEFLDHAGNKIFLIVLGFRKELRLAQEAEQSYLKTGDSDALDQAVNIWQYILSHQAFKLMREPVRLSAINSAGRVFLRRYWHIGIIKDLDSALNLLRKAVENTALISLERPNRLNNLGIGLRARYMRTGQLEDLEEAISVTEQAVKSTPLNSLNYPAILSNLGNALSDRHMSMGRLTDLEEAIRAYEQAVESTPPNSPDLPMRLHNLGHGLRYRYVRAERIKDLEDAILAWQQAVTNTSIDSLERPMYLNSLGVGLASKYKVTGELEDLYTAIRIWREAEASTPPNSPYRSSRLINVGIGFRERYLRTHEMEYLEEAIRVFAQTVKITPQDSPEYPKYLDNLSTALHDRYIRMGRLEDLEEAIRLIQLAVDGLPLDSIERPFQINNLGIRLRDRYVRRGRLDDLEEAIQSHEKAVENAPPKSPQRSTYLNNLGNSLRDRYKRTGRREDLEKAIQRSLQAVETTPEESPDLPARLNNYGNVLFDRYKLSGQLEDLEKAILVYEQALTNKLIDSIEQPVFLKNLAISISSRYYRTRRLSDLDEAKRLFQQACELASNRSLLEMLNCSRVWGNWAFERESWQEASQAYTYGLKSLSSLYKIQFSRTGKESFLRDARGLTTYAAYALTKMKDFSTALEVLESGRARQLGEVLERTRHDLQLLADPVVGHKELLERYRIANGKYNELSLLTANTGLLAEKKTSLLQGWIQQLDAVQVEIDKIIEEIRQVPGYNTFLLSPTAEQIQHQAKYAPLVYFVSTLSGGLALIVTGSDVDVVELPLLTEEILHQQVVDQEGRVTFRSAYLAWRTEPYEELKLEAWKRALDQTARWLWDAVMRPVIYKLKTILSVDSRVILIPSDWLSLLPLHAAWTPDESRPCGRLYALDEFTFTYAPSALALMRTRQQAQEIPADKLLIVENPDQSLFFSEAAVQAASALFHNKTHLSLGAATFATVSDAFKDHNVLYFYTHGIARFDEPLKSALTLSDRPLTLKNIFDLKAGHARLAVLSACETGLPSNLELLDEAVSMPSGLMQAGVPGVVGSLWTVLEASTAILMTIFFEQWRKAGLSAPEALRKAQMILRDAMYNKEARDYFKASIVEGIITPMEMANIMHKELLLNEFDHPFYWAAFTYTGL